MQIPRTRLKKLHRFHFFLFSRTTSKKPSRFTQNFWSPSWRLFVDRDEGQIFTFSIKNHQFSLFWHVYGIFAQKFHPEFINFHPKMTFPCFSSVNHTFDSVHVNSVPTGGNHRQRPGQPHHSLLCSLHRHREAHWRSCQEPGLLKLNRSLEFGCLPLGNTKCDFNVNAIGFLNTFITNQYLASAT